MEVLHVKEDEILLVELDDELSTTSSIKSSNYGTSRSRQSSMPNRILHDMVKPVEFFHGRNSELQTLNKLWLKCISTTSLQIVEITGIPGVGKTELAAQFAKNICEEGKSHCIWINGKSLKSSSSSFQKLAEEMEIFSNDSFGKKKSIDFLAREVYKNLSNSECIIVFDNLDNYCDQPFLTTLIEFDDKQPLLDIKPMVLLITQTKLDSSIFPDKFQSAEIELCNFSPDVATHVILDFLKLGEKDERFIYLAETLGEKLKYHPLALGQAVSCINNKAEKSPIEKAMQTYLDSFEEEMKNSIRFQNLDECSQVVAVTFAVSLKQIMKLPVVGPKAKMALNIVSFFDGDTIIHTSFVMAILKSIKIPTSIRSAICSAIPFTKEIEVFQLLHEYSLLKKISFNSENFICIHQMMQEVIRTELEAEGKTAAILENLLSLFENFLLHDEGISLLSRSQIIHIETVWNHALKIRDVVERHGKLPRKIVAKYFQTGQIMEAYEFSCESAKSLEDVFGDESRFTLRMKFWKGILLKERMEYTEALQLLESVYEKEKNIFGEQDHDCLLTAREIGVVLLRQKKLEEAKAIFEETYKKRENVNGVEHRETLKLLGDIASVHYELREEEEALSIYTKLEEIEERQFGEDDRRTLSTKHNIGTVKFHQGEYNDAVLIFEQVLQAKEKTLESDHADILETKLWLAATYRLLERYEEGLKLAREVYGSQVRLLGAEDQRILVARELVANLEVLLEGGDNLQGVIYE